MVLNLEGITSMQGFPDGASGKNLPANTGVRDMDSIPGLGRSAGEGYDNPLQYFCLQNPMDRGAWRAAVHRVAKSRTRLSDLAQHSTSHAFFHTLVTHVCVI